MKYTVEVTKLYQFELDPEKFTQEFLDEFQDYMFPCATVDDHAEHIATQIEGLDYNNFLEGYGDLKDFGYKLLDDETIEVNITEISDI